MKIKIYKNIKLVVRVLCLDDPLLRVPEFEHFPSVDSLKNSSKDDLSVPPRTTGSIQNGNYGTANAGRTPTTEMSDNFSTNSSLSTGSSRSTPSTGSTGTTGTAWSTLSIGSASKQNVYDPQNIDKILDVMKDVR